MNHAEKAISVKVKTDKKEYIVGATVKMTLEISNNCVHPVELTFASAQRYDFIVLKGNEEVWRWSKDKMFAMVLDSMSLKPGEKRTYVETWKVKAATPGEYKVVGVITSRPPYKAARIFKIRNINKRDFLSLTTNIFPKQVNFRLCKKAKPFSSSPPFSPQIRDVSDKPYART